MSDIDATREGLRRLCVQHIQMSGSGNKSSAVCINAMMVIQELQEEIANRDATIGALIDLQT